MPMAATNVPIMAAAAAAPAAPQPAANEAPQAVKKIDDDPGGLLKQIMKKLF